MLVAYDVLLQRAAELGVGRSGGETPIEYHRRIEGIVPLVDGNLTRLTQLAVRAAYAADGTTTDDAADARADADATLDALQRSVTWRRRLTAPYRRS